MNTEKRAFPREWEASGARMHLRLKHWLPVCVGMTLFLGSTIFAASAAAMAVETGSLDAAQAARYEHLIHELRCLVCQNETIADSQAPLAADLRDQVKRQIAEGKNDDDVMRYLTDRYGDFVRYRPAFKASTVLLWTGPFLLLLLGLVIAWRALRRPKAVPPPRVVSRAEVERILAETQMALKAQDDTRP